MWFSLRNLLSNTLQFASVITAELTQKSFRIGHVSLDIYYLKKTKRMLPEFLHKNNHIELDCSTINNWN